jgi:hypothetical protein
MNFARGSYLIFISLNLITGENISRTRMDLSKKIRKALIKTKNPFPISNDKNLLKYEN